MADFTGTLQGFAATLGEPRRRILLDATAGDIVAGGAGSGGDIRITDDENKLKIRLNGMGKEDSRFPQGEPINVPISILGDGSIRAGSSTTNGKLSLLDGEARELVTLSAATQDLVLRAPDGNGTIALRASEDNVTGLWMGANQHNGLVVLRDRTGHDRVLLRGESGRLDMAQGNGNLTVRLHAVDDDGRAGLWLGDHGMNGFIRCLNAGGMSRIAIDAAEGEVRVQDDKGETTVTLKGNGGSGHFGGRGVHGDVLVYSASVDDRTSDNANIWLQGSSGDIILRNADCAEEFEVRDDVDIEPGAVLVLDPDGRLAVSSKPYDTCVAGVVSGADGIRPGIVLGRTPGAKNRLPVGLAGKVICNVDASFGPIEVGTLLTTSPRAGHAMAATDRERAFGAVIGKAMARLSSGCGRVPVLVALQ